MSSVAKSAKSTGRLPNLNEVGFTLTRILVFLVAAAVALVSFVSGGDVIAIGLRTGVAALAVGLIGWFVNWLLVGGVIDSMNAEVKEFEDAKKVEATKTKPASTIEKSA